MPLTSQYLPLARGRGREREFSSIISPYPLATGYVPVSKRPVSNGVWTFLFQPLVAAVMDDLEKSVSFTHTH